jgi:ribosomal protein L31
MEDRSNIKLVGNTTTGQNIGTGAGVFKCKNNGNNLQFKSVSATGSSIQIIETSDQIYISGATGGGNGTITGATNGLHTSGRNIQLGGIFTGATLINASGGILSYSTHPFFNSDTQIVDKKYVDIIATGLDPKLAVEVTTTLNDGNIDLTGGTFVSGSTIDGIIVQNDWRVLIKNQTFGKQNGIYIYSASTSGFTRSSDFDGSPSGETVQGALIPVITGSTYSNTIWVLVTENPITINVTPLTFGLFSSSSYSAGNSIIISGSTISVDISTGTLTNVLTGATNGLSAVGRNITLGGTLTGDTVIGTATKKLTLGTAGYSIVIDPTAIVIGDETLGANHIFVSPADTDINSGLGNLNLVSNNICVCGTNMNYVTHPIFTGDTQLVDKKYVDDQITGSTTYSSASPSTVTVGGMPASTVLCGRTLESILEEILVEYLVPTFSSFSTAGVPATIEVGCQISGSKSFTFGFTNSSNICANTLSIRDVTLGSNIATACPISSPQSATITSYTATTCGQQQSWCGCVTNTCGTCFGSVAYTTTAYLPYYWGICTCPGPSGTNRPTATCAMVIGGTKILASSSGSISITFNSGNDDYLWFAVPATVSKVCWCTPSAPTNNGAIGGGINPACNLFPAPDVVSVTSACWAGKSYNVYISNAQTSVVIPMALT